MMIALVLTVSKCLILDFSLISNCIKPAPLEPFFGGRKPLEASTGTSPKNY